MTYRNSSRTTPKEARSEATNRPQSNENAPPVANQAAGENNAPEGLGSGLSLEPDPEPRNSPFHKRIVKAVPIEGTRAGNWLELECGHRSMAFGSLEHAHGVVLCQECRSAGPHGPDGLSAYVITKDPSDFPGKFCTRRWVLDSPTNGFWLHDTLEAAQAPLIAAGLVCQGRDGADDSVIVETWA